MLSNGVTLCRRRRTRGSPGRYEMPEGGDLVVLPAVMEEVRRLPAAMRLTEIR